MSHWSFNQAVPHVVTWHWIYPQFQTFLSNYSLSWTLSWTLRMPHVKTMNIQGSFILMDWISSKENAQKYYFFYIICWKNKQYHYSKALDFQFKDFPLEDFCQKRSLWAKKTLKSQDFNDRTLNLPLDLNFFDQLFNVLNP